MKTIQIRDYYINLVASVRINPIALNYIDQCRYKATHYAKLSKGQILKLKRSLPFGPTGVNETIFDRDGIAVEAEIYFDLDA